MLSVQNFVDAQLYQDEETVIQDALRHLLRARPDFRVRLAIYRYQHEAISLAKAASLAGVSWAQMKDILLEHDIPPRLGVEDFDDAKRDIQAVRDELRRQET
jgi:predicted HTH domain antitoxin